MYVLQSPILCVKALFHVCASMTTITNKPCAELTLLYYKLTKGI